MRHVSFGQHTSSLLDRVIAAVRLSKIRPLIKPGSKLLDLGCGYRGGLITSLGTQVRGTGVDLSVDPKNIQLITGRVDRPLPFKDHSFTVVAALAIIEHVDHPEVMLREARRVLKPGGSLVLTTPSLAGKIPLEIMAQLKLISQTEIADHKRYYTRSTLTRALGEAGFKQVRVIHFGIFYLNLLAEART